MGTTIDMTGWHRFATTPNLNGNDPFGTAMARFFGYEHVSVSSITINSIVVASTSNEAPKALMASASNVSAIGTRTLSSNTLNPYQDLEYRWELTYSDDSPIEDLEGIIDPRDSTAVNPYTDQISPEATFIIREAGSYALKLTARGMSSTSLEVIEQTATQAITVVESTQDHLWYDGTSGNDANDGLDPWGFALTTGVYTESTGELTQSGAFASYVHDVSANFTDRDNYIYITKAGVAGLYRIASKTSDDTIVLEQKLGSDQTAVTSSDGAKKVFDGVAISNTNHHLKGGNTYLITNSITPNGKANPVTVSGYNGKPVVTPSGVTYPVELSVNISGSLPAYIRLSNIEFNGNGTQGGIGGINGANGSNSDASVTTLAIDRCGVVNTGTSVGIIAQTTATKLMHLLIYGNNIDNRYGTTSAPSKGIAIYTDVRNDGWTRMFGNRLDSDSDSVTGLEHFVYPNGTLSHFHAGYNNFRFGNGTSSYCLNINNGLTAVSEFISVNNNNAGAFSDWFVDFGNANNAMDDKLLDNIVVINNKSNVAKGFAFFACALDNRFAYNEHWSVYNSQHFIALYSGTGTFDPDLFTGVVDNNNIYGIPSVNFSLGESREVTDNTCYHTDDRITFTYDPADLGAREFIAKDNNLYAPNKTSSTIVSADTTDITLTAFNATSTDIDGNTSTDPSWTDPANGSFNGTPLGLAVTVV